MSGAVWKEKEGVKFMQIPQVIPDTPCGFSFFMGGTESPKQWRGANISLTECKTECLSVATVYFYHCIL